MRIRGFILIILLAIASTLPGDDDVVTLQGGLTLDAFTGGYYFPERNDKASGYNEFYAMHLTNRVIVSRLVRAWFDLGAEEERTQSRLTVHEAHVRWGEPGLSRFSLQAMIGWRQYGHVSHGASLLVADPWWDRNSIEEIRMHGLRLVWHPVGREVQVYADGGGNTTVSGLLDLGVKGQWRGFGYDVYSLMVARDPDYNDPKLGVGGDFSWRAAWSSVVADYRYEHITANVASDDIDKHILFAEGRLALLGALDSHATFLALGGSWRCWRDSMWDAERRDWSAFCEWNIPGDSDSALRPVFIGVNALVRGYDFEGYADAAYSVIPRFQAGPIRLEIPATWTEPDTGKSFLKVGLQFHAATEWELEAR